MKFLSLMFLTLYSLSSFSAVQSAPYEYKHGDKIMQGFLAFDSNVKGLRPGILITPDWMGPTSFTENKAVQLAKMGYVALVVDIYGKGIRPKTTEEAGKLATELKNNRILFQDRMRAAYNELYKNPNVDKGHLLAMGYCVGGTGALELARTGVALEGVVSFHGGLSNPTPNNANNIRGKVLILHGADDPFVSKEEVEHFRTEMKKAEKTFELVSFPGAVHAFAVPTAGSDNKKGAAYNKKADQDSWLAFEKFLNSFKTPHSK